MAIVKRSRRLAADGLTEARHAVAALRQDVPSLTDALAALADAHERDHHARVRFESTGTPGPVPSPHQVPLAATAREALTNAAKHTPGARNRVEAARYAEQHGLTAPAG